MNKILIYLFISIQMNFWSPDYEQGGKRIIDVCEEWSAAHLHALIVYVECTRRVHGSRFRDFLMPLAVNESMNFDIHGIIFALNSIIRCIRFDHPWKIIFEFHSRFSISFRIFRFLIDFFFFFLSPFATVEKDGRRRKLW